MTHGVVKFFNVDQGFGFITPIEGGRDVLVQQPVIEQAGLTGLLSGQRVAFEVGSGQDDGAASVIRIELLAANEDDGRLKRFG